MDTLDEKIQTLLCKYKSEISSEQKDAELIKLKDKKKCKRDEIETPHESNYSYNEKSQIVDKKEWKLKLDKKHKKILNKNKVLERDHPVVHFNDQMKSTNFNVKSNIELPKKRVKKNKSLMHPPKLNQMQYVGKLTVHTNAEKTIKFIKIHKNDGEKKFHNMNNVNNYLNLQTNENKTINKMKQMSEHISHKPEFNKGLILKTNKNIKYENKMDKCDDAPCQYSVNSSDECALNESNSCQTISSATCNSETSQHHACNHTKTTICLLKKIIDNIAMVSAIYCIVDCEGSVIQTILGEVIVMIDSIIGELSCGSNSSILSSFITKLEQYKETITKIKNREYDELTSMDMLKKINKNLCQILKIFKVYKKTHANKKVSCC